MQVRVTPSGSIDKDTDPAYIGRGNYEDANDIRHRQTDGSNFGGVMGVIGNSLKTTIPNYSNTSKKYRVYIDVSSIASGAVASNSGSLYLENSSGSVFSNTGLSISTTNLSTYASTLQGYLNALSNTAYGGLLTIGGLFSTGTYSAYFDVTTTLDTDYIFNVHNTQSELCSFRLIEEYVSPSGSYRVIGSMEYESNLFVWLASEDVDVVGTSYISEIGIMSTTDNGATFTYTRLIKSKKLGFNKERRIDPQIEKVSNTVNLYWTDGNNVPRAMYVDETLLGTTDGMLFSNGGQYDLQTIDIESNLFVQAPAAYFDNISVLSAGGNISAGNKRYTGRFLTDSLSATDFMYPTNPVNIYSKDVSIPSEIVGDDEGTLTSKSVSLTVKNITPGVYKYFELVVLEYGRLSFTSKIVQRYVLGEFQTEIDVVHSDLGQDNISISNEEVIAITSKYKSAENIRIFENRVVLSNLVEHVDYDLTSWAESITHSIEQGFIDSIGHSFNNLASPRKSYTDHTFNEYVDPENVLNRSSYIYNETYRFGVQVMWKSSSKWSLPYWVDDIRIDLASSNVVGNRRITSSTGVDINLQDSSLNYTKHYYVDFHNVNLDYVIPGLGQKVRDAIAAFRFVRSERIPEVIATGIFYAAADTNLVTEKRHPTVPVYPFFGYTNGSLSGVAQPLAGSAGYISGTAQNLSLGYGTVGGAPTIFSFNSTCGGTGTADRSNILFFYSPDLKYGVTSYSPDLSKDEIRLAAAPNLYGTFSGYSSNSSQRHADGSNTSHYREYGGYFGATTEEYTSFSVLEHQHLNEGNNTTMGGLVVENSFDYSGYMQSVNASCELFRINNTAHGNTAIADNGMWYGQIFRDLGGNKKYPSSKELTEYQSTGHMYVLDPGQNGTIDSISVFGGDSFIQASHMALVRMPHSANGLWGGGYGISLYSQNVGNIQMAYIVPHDLTFTGEGYQFPQYLDKEYAGRYWFLSGTSTLSSTLESGSIGSGLFYWLEQWPEVSRQLHYNSSYNHVDNSITERGYKEEDSDYTGELPSRIVWSAKKFIGSTRDDYRIFKPLDFADLDITNGPIRHHEVLSSNFYTWQDRSVQRQYFRDGSLVNASNGADIVVGAGSILGIPGQELTSIGMNKKWSHVKGSGSNGKDTFYWVNDNLQKIVRLGADGTRVISDRGFVSFMTNNAKYNAEDLYHLTGLGIHGVWNDKYSEAIFTFKYRKPGDEGQYNFTVAYDEVKDGFVSFHSYYPNIYLKYRNTFFSVDPSNQNKIYLHDAGNESTYYSYKFNPNLTMVMNYDTNVSKIFEAIQVVSDKQPSGIFFTTSSKNSLGANYVSYLDLSDFEAREDLWYSTIKNESNTTGFNNGDTSRLFGKWLKIKISLNSANDSQKLINAIVKFRPNSRLYTQ